MLNPASDDMICGMTCDGCCDGARENVIATVMGRLMGRGEPARVTGHVGRNGKVFEVTRREDDRRWCLVSARRGGSASALEGWRALVARQMSEDEKFCRRDLMVWKMIEDERLS